MKLLTICTLIPLIAANAKNDPKQIQNILNVLSLLNVKPDSYIKLATNANETQCNQDISTIFTETAKTKLWAMNILDATAKLPDTLRDFNRVYYGDFEQCLETEIPHSFTPQYCLLSINVVKYVLPDVLIWARHPMIYYGICLPSTCSPKYIERILQNVQFPSHGKNLSQDLEIFIEEGNCAKPDDATVLTPLNWITILFLVTVTFFVIASTIYEAIFPSKYLSLYTSFSLLTTGREIFEPDTSAKAINGFRGILACVVIMGHFSAAILDGNIKNATFGNIYQDSVLLGTATHTIDAFLIISGLFAVFAFYKEATKTKSYDPVKAVVNRSLRLIAPAGVIYLIRLGIFEHLHRGPVYKAFNNYRIRNCHDFPWSVLLGYENFKHPRCIKQCFPQFWYLSLDMQLFLFTQIIFVISTRKPKSLYQLAFVFFLLCDLLTFYLSYIHDCGWTLSLTIGYSCLDNVYSFPYTRGVSWFAGMLWAAITLKNRKTDFSKHKVLQTIMWFLTIVCLWYSHEYLRGKNFGTHTQPEAAFYSAFHHVTSAIAYGWIIFTLINQISGPLGVFLSWGPMVFLGSISYEIFLIHFTVIEFIIAIARHNVYYTFNRFIYHSIAVIGFSTVAALVFALFITRPISNLTSLATRGVKIMPFPFEIKEETGTSDHAKKQ